MTIIPYREGSETSTTNRPFNGASFWVLNASDDPLPQSRAVRVSDARHVNRTDCLAAQWGIDEDNPDDERERAVIVNQQDAIAALEQRVAEYAVKLAEQQGLVERLKRVEEVNRVIGEQLRALFDNHKAIFLLVKPYSGAIVYANSGINYN